MLRLVHAQRARTLRKRGVRVTFYAHHAGRNGALRPVYAWDGPPSRHEHEWEYVADWEGDPGVVNGTHDISFLRCASCGAENHDLDPNDYRPDFDDSWEYDNNG